MEPEARFDEILSGTRTEPVDSAIVAGVCPGEKVAVGRGEGTEASGGSAREALQLSFAELPNPVRSGEGDHGNNVVQETVPFRWDPALGNPGADNVVGGSVLQPGQAHVDPGSGVSGQGARQEVPQATESESPAPQEPTQEVTPQEPTQEITPRQVVINATDLSVTDVNWPGIFPLFELPTGLDLDRPMEVMQIHFWSPIINSWIKLVSMKSGEQGVVEVTPADIEGISQGQAQGLPKVEAIRRVLGIMVNGQ